ncbi:hypothetical protein [Helicobacter trogontum]|uniref:Uncharacterized protein n=1 Tax=Helicobacter trogontum TaxID=50960 RepID=A0A4U8SAE4_9HELI|nr:hypothetical protein [Helicobacter trogontum]TLD82990.1 hypothetical protein LS81_006510 [Helicobacter trogontum]
MLQNKFNVLDSESSSIIWKGKRKFYLITTLFYLIYLIFGIFISCFFWTGLLQKSFWYILIAIPLTLFSLYEVYKALNLKAVLLTQNGLLLKTLFNGDVFYPYGYFTAGSSLAIGIKYFERVSVDNTNHSKMEFLFPYGYDSLGSFKNNQEFKALYTKHTNQALESLNLQDKVNLYKLYQSNIECIFDEERNHNIFTIDFSPYKAEIDTYLKDKQ